MTADPRKLYLNPVEKDPIKHNAVTRQLIENVANSFRPTSVYVKVVNDGVTDDGPAIQAAIDSLPLTGGLVEIVPALASTGPCLVNSTINIGLGSSSVISSTTGVILRGPNVPGWGTGFLDNEAWPNFTLQWNGGAAPFISVNGPLQGWGLQNLRLDCATVATIGILVMSASLGDSRNLVILNASFALIYSTTVAQFGTLANASCNSEANNWTNIQIISYVSSVYGIVLTGEATTTSNTCFNTFVNVFSGNNVYLGACDSNTFYNVNIAAGADPLGPITFDYTAGGGSWPANNAFYSVGYGSVSEPNNVGTPGANASANYFYSLGTTNNAKYVTLANLLWGDVGNASSKTASTAVTIGDEAQGPLIFTAASTVTLTLPDATFFPGRWIYLKTLVSDVVSASSNVKPIGSDTAGTAILAASAGKWAALQSNGTDWIVMMSN